MRDASAAAVAALRSFLTGPVIRRIADIKDMGEVILAKVTNLDGGDHLDTEGDADVWAHYEDTLSGYSGIARLFVPGNILFGMPNDGDTAMVLRPRTQHGPGVNYLLHGDLGDASRVPSWIREKVGLWIKDKILRLESDQHAVEVQAGSGQDITLNGGTAKVARVGDGVNMGSLVLAVAGGGGVTIAATYTAPGSAPVVVPPSASITINLATGQITSGADHVKA